MRDKLPSSRILQALRQAGIDLNIIQVKQLLRELNLPFNGPSTSMINLIQAVKTMIHGERSGDERSQSDASLLVSNKTIEKLKGQLQGIFYNSKRSMYTLFKLATND